MQQACSPINWLAVSSVATIFAVLVALFLGLLPIWLGWQRGRAQVDVIRRQFVCSLLLARTPVQARTLEAIRGTAFDPYEAENVEALQPLMVQAHLLEPDEYKAILLAVSTLRWMRSAYLGGIEVQADKVNAVLSNVEDAIKVISKRTVKAV